MCGIFAILSRNEANIDANHHWKTIQKLFKESSRRGQDCAGLYFYNGKDELHSVNASHPTSILTKENKSRVIENLKFAQQAITIGQTRMITNGNSDHSNIQPLCGAGTVLSHNGIITNEKYLNQKHKIKVSVDDVDTKSALHILENSQDDVDKLMTNFINFEGANNFIFFNKKNETCYLHSSHGSLYFATLDQGTTLVASEKRILENVLTLFQDQSGKIEQCQPKMLYVLKFDTQDIQKLEIQTTPKKNLKPSYVKS